jgi:hypothetical protein
MARRSIAAAAIRLSVLVLAAPAAQAQLPAVGSEFQVNTFTTYRQYSPRVAAAPTGEFVVVWANHDGNGPLAIMGQRYDAAGVAQGGELRADSDVILPLDNRVAVAASGAGFVVVWDSFDLGGPQWGIRARRFDAGGAAQGAEFQVNTYTTNDQRRPAVAADAAGNFVVVWESYGQSTGPLASSVIGRRFDGAGVPQGGEFTVNGVYYDQRRPDVASDAAGNFVVVWHGYEGVAARLFDAAGVAQGGEFVVDPYGAFAAVDADAAGFVVAWDGGGDIWTRRYDDAGVPQGPAFQANTFTMGTLRRPDVALGASGDFAVTWSSAVQDGSGYGVFGRRYDADGTPRGDDFRVNTYTTGNQDSPSIAGGAGGRFVIAWQSEAQDGDDDGVFARRYDPSAATTTTTSVTSTTSSSVTTTSSTSTTSTTSTTIEHLFPVRILSVKPGTRFKFVARGTFALPQAADAPTVDGALLRFLGTTTANAYNLQPGGWRGIGPGGDGSRGFKFRGTLCSVLLRPTVLKAVCRDDTGDFVVPYAGDVDLTLSIGGTTRYCGQCGGTSSGNPDVIYKRLDCAAPASCS